jgi:hypothetical protein
MADGINIRATLTGLRIKPGKEAGDDPIVTVTIETGYEDDLSALNGRIGHVVDLRVAFVQAALPMARR